MDVYTAQRVLVEYENSMQALRLLEERERSGRADQGSAQEALSASQREEFLRADQFQLGRIEGLVQAQLTLGVLREQFARRHRPSAAGWSRSLDEAGPGNL